MGPIIENEITLPFSISPLKALEDYSGTRIKIVEKVDATMDVIYNEIEQNKPVITYIDSFDCYWMTYYLKIHADHYIMLIGFNADYFYVLDPYLIGSINKIPRTTIKNSLLKNNIGRMHIQIPNEKLYIFDKIGYQNRDFVEVLKQVTEKYIDIYHFYMDELYNFFCESQTIYLLLDEEEIVCNKFYFDIKSIVDSRIDFLHGLQFMYNNSYFQNIIKIEFLSNFEEIVNLWKRILSCLYRFSYTNSSKKKMEILLRSKDYLKSQIKMEYSFAKQILVNTSHQI